MSRIDVMVDLETLGVSDCPPVFQLNAKAFDVNTGKILDGINLLCDVTTTESEVGQDTLMWWFKTNIDLFTKLIKEGMETKWSEKDMFSEFVRWFNALGDKKNTFLWGNGVNFDNRIIQKKCEQYGLEYPVFFRNDMDMRTVLEMAAMKTGYTDQVAYRAAIGFKGTKHNADDDVTNQIRDIVRAVKDLKGEIR